DGVIDDLVRLGQRAGVVEGAQLAVILGQTRLVIEGIDVTGTALHEQEDHALGARRNVHRPGVQRVGGGAAEQSAKGEMAETAGGGQQRLTARRRQRLRSHDSFSRPASRERKRPEESSGRLRSRLANTKSLRSLTLPARLPSIHVSEVDARE